MTETDGMNPECKSSLMKMKKNAGTLDKTKEATCNGVPCQSLVIK